MILLHSLFLLVVHILLLCILCIQSRFRLTFSLLTLFDDVHYYLIHNKPALSQKISSPNMRAVQIKDGKGPSSNLYIDENTPVPKLDGSEERQEILVKVIAFGLNRMDLLQREGQYPLPPGASPILGVEFSGTVDDPGNSSFKKGDEVFGLALGGAYAELIKVPARMVLPKPKELSWEQAAAIPESEFAAEWTTVVVWDVPAHPSL